MKCPYCGEEMWMGSMTTSGRSVFLEGLDPERHYRRIMVSKATLSGEGSPAFFCQSCRKLVMDVPQLQTLEERIKKGIDAVTDKVSDALEDWDESREQKSEEKKRGRDPWEW